MYMKSDEYHRVMEKLKPQNLNKEQLESDIFIKEIEGFIYTVKNTDSGCIVINKQKGNNNDSN